jgi:hypothetical protein
VTLAWETDDPARLHAVLAVAGFRVAADGTLEIHGLRLVVRPSSGADRLLLLAAPGASGGAIGGAAEGAVEDAAEGAVQSAAAGQADPGPGAVRLRALAIAVVDIDRAVRAREMGLVDPSGDPSPGSLLPDDTLLGARVATTGTLGVVVAEPVTEGRLAATLARHGEGPAALYLAVPVPTAGTATVLDGLHASFLALGERPRHGAGPFGVQLLARTRPPWGPHVLLVPDTLPGPGRAAGRSATIAP